MNFLFRILVSAIIAYGLSYWLKGIHMDSYLTAIGFALILAIVNAFVKPVLVILTLPVTVFTLGLFLLVINALMVLLVDSMMEGVYIKNFWWALLFSLLFSIITTLFFSGSERNQR